MVYTLNSTFSEIVSDPSFGSFGRLIFPVHGNHLSGSTLENLHLTFYSDGDQNIVPEKSVEVVNFLKASADGGNTVFYDIYTADEKAADPEKNDTGLFFFRGEPGSPFAVVCAGGGFQFVGAIHGSFPLALELAKKGYNAFAIIYRPDERKASENLARAIAFIFGHADELNVCTKGYSLWGESAGARMAANLGSYGTEGYGEAKLPKAAAIVMQYTGHQDFTKDDPPTYANAGRKDLWHLDRAMEARYQAMKAAGIPVELKIYESLPHGYALGVGTEAEGWHEEAIAFWEAHR